MKAVVGALGINSDRLKVIISQMVTLCRGGEVVRLSKRSGDIIPSANWSRKSALTPAASFS